MSATSALLAGRAAARELMFDTAQVGRSEGALDPDTFEPIETIVYDGPVKVQSYEAFERAAEVGGSTIVVQRYQIHIPVGSFDPEPSDVFTITSSRLDPLLVGRRFRVAAPFHKTGATAYRIPVDDLNAEPGDDAPEG